MSQTLPTELDALIYRGLMLPADDDDPWVFLLELAKCTVRREVTDAQAHALCEMVGLSPADHAAAVERVRVFN